MKSNGFSMGSIWIPINCLTDFHMESDGFPIDLNLDSVQFPANFHMDSNRFLVVFTNNLMDSEGCCYTLPHDIRTYVTICGESITIHMHIYKGNQLESTLNLEGIK